jgi:hypothetical protein
MSHHLAAPWCVEELQTLVELLAPDPTVGRIAEVAEVHVGR